VNFRADEYLPNPLFYQRSGALFKQFHQDCSQFARIVPGRMKLITQICGMDRIFLLQAFINAHPIYTIG